MRVLSIEGDGQAHSRVGPGCADHRAMARTGRSPRLAPRRAASRARSRRAGSGPASHALRGGVREEQLLAVDLIVGDRLLTLRRDQPVDEGLAEVLLHMRVLGRVDQDYAVLVEQPPVALDHDLELAAVLE